MGIAATPRYMQDNAAGFYEQLSPGLAFYTFFPIWTNQWKLDGHAKTDALQKVLTYSDSSRKQTEALIKRQNLLIKTVGDNLGLSVSAKSSSPFMTGTGMEHPLENGFAFLNPYGLPYLPGSSVKGVLRNTARLLAEDAFGEGNQGWTGDTILTLFGSEVPRGQEESDHFRRGALTFWDVIVSPKSVTTGGKESQSMKVDILTPHQSHYLQGTATPHDSGEPNPVPFLCVGPGAEFNFHVQANAGLLGDCTDNWQELIHACFTYAFDWLGFGAKTAVGYGILAMDKVKAEAFRQAQEAAKAAAEFDAKTKGMTDNQKAIEEFKKNLPPEAQWKGKGPGQGPGFGSFATTVESWTDAEDLKVAIAFFEEKIPVWLNKPVKDNDTWKKRLNGLKRKAGLL